MGDRKELSSKMNAMNMQVERQLRRCFIKLLLYNSVAISILAHERVRWSLPYEGTVIAERLGEQYELPKLSPRFGGFFHLVTIILHCMPLIGTTKLRKPEGNFLLPCILWNVYMLAAAGENTLEIILVMYKLDVAIISIVNVVLISIFAAAFHSKLLLKLFQCYEFSKFISKLQ